METHYNLKTYLEFRGDLTFKESGFNELDAGLLCTLISVDYTNLPAGDLPISELSRLYFSKREEAPLSFYEEILLLMGQAPRFQDVKFRNYVKEVDVDLSFTFYAVTFVLDRFHLFICYRGTDDTMVSWKENFHTLYQTPTPGQFKALSYAANALQGLFVRGRICGHSKGANLANYAALHLPDKLLKKVSDIYSFDGPGFTEDVTKLPNYPFFLAKLHSFIPEESVVGRILNPPYASLTVASESRSLNQHFMRNWRVYGNHFVPVEKPDAFSDQVVEQVNNWIESIPIEERKDVIDELFDTLTNAGIASMDDFKHLDAKSVFNLLIGASKLGSGNKKLLSILISTLLAR